MLTLDMVTHDDVPLLYDFIYCVIYNIHFNRCLLRSIEKTVVNSA